MRCPSMSRAVVKARVFSLHFRMGPREPGFANHHGDIDGLVVVRPGAHNVSDESVAGGCSQLNVQDECGLSPAQCVPSFLAPVCPCFVPGSSAEAEAHAARRRPGRLCAPQTGGKGAGCERRGRREATVQAGEGS